jgi:hypothetical protein
MIVKKFINWNFVRWGLGLGACFVTALLPAAEPPADPATEALINELTKIDAEGHGYSAWAACSVFLPYSEKNNRAGIVVLGAPAPAKSNVLEQIVRRGAKAVPLLLKHLDDPRKTKIKPLHGMMWMSFEDRYDFNSRTRKVKPKGVNKENRFDPNQPVSHTVTVGDLCFVALGQIVNRNFTAAGYQSTGGLIVNSPSSSKQLAKVTRAEWGGLKPGQHLERLTKDFIKPDYPGRRLGAYFCLSLYHPGEAEKLALEQLQTPVYDFRKPWAFVYKRLFLETTAAKRGELIDAFIKANGKVYLDALRLKLFDYLEDQETSEAGRSFPPLDKKYDARGVLISYFGYPKTVQSNQRPFVESWNNSDLTDFINVLTRDKSKKIDQSVFQVFSKIRDDDDLALACMTRLIGRGYDDQLRAYCKRRLGKDKSSTKDLRKMLARLSSKNR